MAFCFMFWFFKTNPIKVFRKKCSLTKVSMPWKITLVFSLQKVSDPRVLWSKIKEDVDLMNKSITTSYELKLLNIFLKTTLK